MPLTRHVQTVTASLVVILRKINVSERKDKSLNSTFYMYNFKDSSFLSVCLSSFLKRPPMKLATAWMRWITEQLMRGIRNKFDSNFKVNKYNCVHTSFYNLLRNQ